MRGSVLVGELAFTTNLTITVPEYRLVIQKSGSAGGLVTSSPAGINCGSTCSAMFSYGKDILLTASPAQGVVLEGWGLAGRGYLSNPNGNPTVFHITGDSTIVPRFRYETLTTLSTDPNPSILDQPTTLNARVTSGTPGTITGSVTFKKGTEILGSADVTSGWATHSTSALPQGTHSLTATYSGDTQYGASTSNAVSHSVDLPPFGPPPGFAATITGGGVQLRWTAVNGAVQYHLARKAAGSDFSVIQTLSGTSFLDTQTDTNTAYAYKVRAVGASGSTSAYSESDTVATTSFTDDPLQAGMTIRAAHLLELRDAINAVRAVAGLGPMSFSEGSPAVGAPIKATHVNELRAALDEARTQFGLPALTYASTPVRGSVVRAGDVQLVRDACH